MITQQSPSPFSLLCVSGLIVVSDNGDFAELYVYARALGSYATL